MRIMCQVGGCNHTRAGHKWSHSLEVLLTHPTNKFFQVSTYFSGSSLCQICAIWGFFISLRKPPKEQFTCDANSNYSEAYEYEKWYSVFKSVRD